MRSSCCTSTAKERSRVLWYITTSLESRWLLSVKKSDCRRNWREMTRLGDVFESMRDKHPVWSPYDVSSFWFCFDDRDACLGANVCCHPGVRILTSLCRVKDESRSPRCECRVPNPEGATVKRPCSSAFYMSDDQRIVFIVGEVQYVSRPAAEAIDKQHPEGLTLLCRPLAMSA